MTKCILLFLLIFPGIVSSAGVAPVFNGKVNEVIGRTILRKLLEKEGAKIYSEDAMAAGALSHPTYINTAEAITVLLRNEGMASKSTEGIISSAWQVGQASPWWRYTALMDFSVNAGYGIMGWLFGSSSSYSPDPLVNPYVATGNVGVGVSSLSGTPEFIVEPSKPDLPVGGGIQSSSYIGSCAYSLDLLSATKTITSNLADANDCYSVGGVLEWIFRTRINNIVAAGGHVYQNPARCYSGQWCTTFPAPPLSVPFSFSLDDDSRDVSLGTTISYTFPAFVSSSSSSNISGGGGFLIVSSDWPSFVRDFQAAFSYPVVQVNYTYSNGVFTYSFCQGSISTSVLSPAISSDRLSASLSAAYVVRDCSGSSVTQVQSVPLSSLSAVRLLRKAVPRYGLEAGGVPYFGSGSPSAWSIPSTVPLSYSVSSVSYDIRYLVNSYRSFSSAVSAVDPIVGKQYIDSARIAAFVNNAWQLAAQQPGYSGAPYSVDQAVTASDVDSMFKDRPDLKITVADMLNNAEDSTGNVPIGINIYTTVNNYYAYNTVGGGGNNNNAKIDLGPDPGTPEPTLDQPPTSDDISQPITDLAKDFKNFAVPSHGQCVCPTFSLSVFGSDFVIDSHCTIMESHRATIGLIMTAVWGAFAFFLVLRA